MKHSLKIASSLLFSSLLFVACSTEPKQEKNADEQANQETIEALELKLQATENQLLNVRNELAKCTGDSLDSKRK
tara:strand:+ start:60 stop:284 length:225 start_codon:yes stop_codon:yes gene_type:complete